MKSALFLSLLLAVASSAQAQRDNRREWNRYESYARINVKRNTLAVENLRVDGLDLEMRMRRFSDVSTPTKNDVVVFNRDVADVLVCMYTSRGSCGPQIEAVRPQWEKARESLNRELRYEREILASIARVDKTLTIAGDLLYELPPAPPTRDPRFMGPPPPVPGPLPPAPAPRVLGTLSANPSYCRVTEYSTCSVYLMTQMASEEMFGITTLVDASAPGGERVFKCTKGRSPGPGDLVNWIPRGKFEFRLYPVRDCNENVIGRIPVSTITVTGI